MLRKGKTVPEKPFQKVRRPHKDRRTDAGEDPVLGISLQAVDDGGGRAVAEPFGIAFGDA